MKESNKGINRRDFLKSTAIGVGCLSLGGVREALAQVKITGKPLLTDKSLNEIFLSAIRNRNKAVYTNLLNEAKTNLYKFLSKYFTLTPIQATLIKNISKQNIEEINKGIEMAVRNREPISAEFIGAPTKGTVKLTANVSHKESSDGGSSTTGSVGVEITY